jgi:hypothetical protein
MPDITASSLRITVATDITCRFFLGANCIAGTLLVDKGVATPTPANRLVSVAAGEKYTPKFPIVTDDGDVPATSTIHCSGSTDATIFFSP